MSEEGSDGGAEQARVAGVHTAIDQMTDTWVRLGMAPRRMGDRTRVRLCYLGLSGATSVHEHQLGLSTGGAAAENTLVQDIERSSKNLTLL